MLRPPHRLGAICSAKEYGTLIEGRSSYYHHATLIVDAKCLVDNQYANGLVALIAILKPTSIFRMTLLPYTVVNIP